MLIPHGAIVLVADGANLRVFRNTSKDYAPKLDPMTTDTKFSARSSTLGTDRPGRVFESVGVSRSSYGSPDFHQVNEDRFAIEIAARLEAVLGENAQGVLIAAPRTLGVIRKHISPTVRSRLIAEIAKDYAQHNVGDVEALLHDHEG